MNVFISQIYTNKGFVPVLMLPYEEGCTPKGSFINDVTQILTFSDPPQSVTSLMNGP